MDVTPEKQYRDVTNAFKTPGRRCIFNKKEGRFENVTTAVAKKRAQSKDYETNLHQIAGRISELANKLDSDKVTRLHTIFHEREAKLANRFVLFGRAKRNTALKGFKEIQSVVVRSLADKTKRPQNEIGTQTKPPAAEPIATQTEAPKGQKQAEPIATQTEAPRATEAKKAALPPQEQPTTLTSKAQPPPLAGAKAPPPPPPAPPSMGEMKSKRHREFSRIRSDFVEGELPAPRLSEKIDVGKLKNLHANERATLKDVLLPYVKNLEMVTTGIREKLDQHMQLDGKMKETQELELEAKTQLQQVNARLEEMQMKEQKGETYYLFVTERDALTGKIQVKAEIPFLAQAEISEMREQWEAVSEKNREKILKQLNVDTFDSIINARTITSLQAVYSDKMKEINLELTRLQKMGHQYSSSLKKLESEKSGSVPFSSYKNWLEDREQLLQSSQSILKNLERLSTPMKKRAANIVEPEKKPSRLADYFDPESTLGSALEHIDRLPDELGVQKMLLKLPIEELPEISNLQSRDEIRSA